MDYELISGSQSVATHCSLISHEQNEYESEETKNKIGRSLNAGHSLILSEQNKCELEETSEPINVECSLIVDEQELVISISSKQENYEEKDESNQEKNKKTFMGKIGKNNELFLESIEGSSVLQIFFNNKWFIPKPKETISVIAKETINPIIPLVQNQPELTPQQREKVEQITKRVQQETNKTGRIEIALKWYDMNDLDLHVIDPYGEEIYYSNRKASKSGGELDVDMNVSPTTNDPVEHIVFQQNPPTGVYKVYVKFFCRHVKNTSNYEVLVKNGEKQQIFTGQVTYAKQKNLVTEFSYP